MVHLSQGCFHGSRQQVRGQYLNQTEYGLCASTDVCPCKHSAFPDTGLWLCVPSMTIHGKVGEQLCCCVLMNLLQEEPPALVGLVFILYLGFSVINGCFKVNHWPPGSRFGYFFPQRKPPSLQYARSCRCECDESCVTVTFTLVSPPPPHVGGTDGQHISNIDPVDA